VGTVAWVFFGGGVWLVGSVGGWSCFVLFGELGAHLGQEDPGGGRVGWFLGVDVGLAWGVTGGVGGG
jgi:hypothetical protein